MQKQVTAKETALRNEVGQEEAAVYEDKRFTRSKRMQLLNAMEMQFAQRAMDLVGPEGSVLDMPCGSGRFFEIFSPAKELYLFDYSAAMLDQLVIRHPEAKTRDLRAADILAIPLEDNSVDLAFCMRLFHHMEEADTRRTALRELSRISKRYVAFSYYSTRNWRYLKKRLRGKQPSRNPVRTQEILSEAHVCGLKLLEKHVSRGWIEQQRCLLFEKQ